VVDRGYTALAIIRNSCLEQWSSSDGISDDTVWRVEAGQKIRQLTAQEAKDLASAGDLEERIGIVPQRVIEELRGVSKEIQSVK